jgi:flagellar M-ring protein FliF
MEGARDFTPVPSITFTEVMMRQSGSFVSAITILAVAGMLIWFGLRPAMNTILASTKSTETAQLQAADAAALLALADGTAARLAFEETPNLVQDISLKALHAPQKRLEQIIQLDEKQAVAILKQWIRQEESV